MPIYCIFIFIVITFIITAFLIYVANTCTLPEKEGAIVFSIIFVVVLIAQIIWMIIYFNANKQYEIYQEAYQCYWIDGQPYYKQDKELFGFRNKVDENIPSDAKIVTINYRILDKTIYYFALHPISDKKEFKNIEYKFSDKIKVEK